MDILNTIFYSYICPICKNTHKTQSRYSYTVCFNCLEKYGKKDNDNNDVEFFYSRINSKIYREVENYITLDRECFVNGYPCYANEQMLEDGSIVLYIIKTIPIPGTHDNKPTLRLRHNISKSGGNNIPNNNNLNNSNLNNNSTNNTNNLNINLLSSRPVPRKQRSTF